MRGRKSGSSQEHTPPLLVHESTVDTTSCHHSLDLLASTAEGYSDPSEAAPAVGVHSLTADDRGPVLEVRRPFYLRRRDRVNSRDVLLGVLLPPLQLPLLVGQVLAAALGGARRQLRLGGCLWLCIALCPSWKRRKVEKDEKKKEEVREGVGKGRERWSV